MSEAEQVDPVEPEVPDIEEPEVPDEETEPDVNDDEQEGEPGKPAPSEDWEKRAHNQAGRAAREKSRRQAAERRAAELEARLERLERQTGGDQDELLELIASLPEGDDDPVGDIATLKRALKTLRARQLQETDQERRQRTVTRYYDGIRTAMADAEADFQTDHPDYMDAAMFYRRERAQELHESGLRGDGLDTALARDLYGIVQTAVEGGYDPAERVYALAKRRGWKAGQKAADAKLDKLNKAAGTSVRPAAQAAPGVLSWGDVAKLDGAARDKAWAKLAAREKQLDRLAKAKGA